MVASTETENQIRIFNSILAIGERVDRLDERIDRRFEQIDRRFEQVDQRLERLEDRVNQIEIILIDVRDLVQRLSPRGIGFNPTPESATPQSD